MAESVRDDILATLLPCSFDGVPFGFASGVQAIKDSGFEVTDANTSRIGVAMGAGIGGLSTIEENTAK